MIIIEGRIFTGRVVLRSAISVHDSRAERMRRFCVYDVLQYVAILGRNLRDERTVPCTRLACPVALACRVGVRVRVRCTVRYSGRVPLPDDNKL